jgi:hypothetical protein
MTAKHIGLEVRDGASGLVVAVTFPLPFTGRMVTRDVAISDDAAKRLIAKVEELLAARGVKRLPQHETK